MHSPLFRRRLVAVAAVYAVVALGAANAARAEDAAPCSYAMQLTALTGPAGADLTIGVDPAQGCAPVDSLKKIQLKTYRVDGKLDDVRNITDKAAAGGVANVDLGQLPRNRRVEADVLVQVGPDAQTHVVRGHTVTLLRPDVTVAAVQAPAQTLTTRTVSVRADIDEVNGDVGASATVTLSWGPTVLATQTATVAKGGRVSVAFDGVALTTAAPTELTVRVSDVTPGETDATNDARTMTVDVTENELARSRLVLQSLGGYGAQFNGHVYAPISAVPPAALPDLEAKVKALEPQVVRIFYNEQWEENVSPGSRIDYVANLASFKEAVELAQEAGATINITYQTAANAKLKPDPYMSRFAAVLDDLVRVRGLANVRWVTIQNEPNAPTNTLTLDQYNALYRSLNAQLVARGLRDHVGLMGGDLVESAGARDQRVWLPWIAANMGDILDAYSVHIYWNYWDLQRMEFRLKDVRKLVTRSSRPTGRSRSTSWSTASAARRRIRASRR
jgi:hypothetical protein